MSLITGANFDSGTQKHNQYNKYKRNQGKLKGCIKLEGYFGGSCANCKRQDKGSTCTVRDKDTFNFRAPPITPKESFSTGRGRRVVAPVIYKAPDGRKKDFVLLDE